MQSDVADDSADAASDPGQEGRYPVVMESTCLNDILDGVAMVLEPMAEKRHIALHFEAKTQVDLTADQSLMAQLLLNLTENAVKYGKDGGGVWVQAHLDGGRAILAVADNGVGVSEENLPHLFECFPARTPPRTAPAPVWDSPSPNGSCHCTEEPSPWKVPRPWARNSPSPIPFGSRFVHNEHISKHATRKRCNPATIENPAGHLAIFAGLLVGIVVIGK